MNAQITAIQSIVAENCYVTEESLFADTRKREIVDAKHIFRTELLLLYQNKSSILERETGIDHSTFLYSQKTYDDLCKTDTIFWTKAKNCRQEIQQYFIDREKNEAMLIYYNSFIRLIKLIELGKGGEELQENILHCKKKINHILGYQQFEV